MPGPDHAAGAKTLEVLRNHLDLLVEFNNQPHLSEDVKAAVNEMMTAAEYVQGKRQELLNKLWDGTITDQEIEMLHPNYFSFQESIAQRALQNLDAQVRSEKLSDVTMVYQINDQSEFVRGYLSHGKMLNPENNQDQQVIHVLDQSFHSWLIKNKLVSVDGVIYHQPTKAYETPTQKVNAKVMSELIEDKDKGLAKKQEAFFKLTVQAHQATSAEPDHAPQTTSAS